MNTVSLPLSVEEKLQRICRERSLPWPEPNALEKLNSLGEGPSLDILQKISRTPSEIRTLTGFIIHMAKEFHSEPARESVCSPGPHNSLSGHRQYNSMAEASGSRRKRATLTAEEMLRPATRTKTTIRRSGPRAVAKHLTVAAAATASTATPASPIPTPTPTAPTAAPVAVQTPVIIVPVPTIDAALPVGEVRPVAYYVAIPSSSEQEEAVRMADAMITPPEVGDGIGAEVQASAGSQTRAWEAEGSTQAGPSGTRYEPGFHMSCLVDWAAKYSLEEEIVDLLSKPDDAFLKEFAAVLYKSVPRLLLAWEGVRERRKIDAELETLRAEVGVLQNEAASLWSEQGEWRRQVTDGKAKEFHLQGIITDLEAKGLRLQGSVEDLTARCDAATAELTRSRAHADALAQENARLSGALDRARIEAAKELSRAVLQAKETQQAEDKASLAEAIAAALEAFKTSKERDAEAIQFYDRGYDDCIEAVLGLYPDLNLDSLLSGEGSPVDEVRPDQVQDAQAPTPST